jgi:hypothetical protein
MPTLCEVNKPWPGPALTRPGAVMELWGDGLVVITQMPGLRRKELQAFKKSFKRYSYLESGHSIPMGLWVFDFPNPHGVIDVNFNSRVADPEFVDSYLEKEGGQVKNALTFYLLDRDMLKGIKLVGLVPAAVKLFHATIKKQCATDYSKVEYSKHLDALYAFTTEELFALGKKFTKTSKLKDV